MVDCSGHSPFGIFKGQTWIFLVSPIYPSSPASIRKFADHPGTTGELVGGPGMLSLYRYTESPFGAYDQLSYSPGWYEYLNIQKRWPYSTVTRITKSYVSCFTGRDLDYHKREIINSNSVFCTQFYYYLIKHSAFLGLFAVLRIP